MPKSFDRNQWGYLTLADSERLGNIVGKTDKIKQTRHKSHVRIVLGRPLSFTPKNPIEAKA